MNDKPTFEEFIKIMAERMSVKLTPVQEVMFKHIAEGKRLYVNLPPWILRRG